MTHTHIDRRARDYTHTHKYVPNEFLAILTMIILTKCVFFISTEFRIGELSLNSSLVCFVNFGGEKHELISTRDGLYNTNRLHSLQRRVKDHSEFKTVKVKEEPPHYLFQEFMAINLIIKKRNRWSAMITYVFKGYDFHLMFRFFSFFYVQGKLLYFHLLHSI